MSSEKDPAPGGDDTDDGVDEAELEDDGTEDLTEAGRDIVQD